MRYVKFLSRLKFGFCDDLEEQEYLQTKANLLKSFFTYLLVCVIILSILCMIRFFFFINLPHQGYVSVGALIIAILLLVGRKFFGKWTEYIMLAYVLCIVITIILNINHFNYLSPASCEAFYGGYSLALVHRLLGYRIIQVKSMIVFHLLSSILRLAFLNQHDIFVTLVVTTLEFFTIIISIMNETQERKFFDFGYKSKAQLIKFKDLLTERVPNPIAIFNKNYSHSFYVNKAFQNCFQCDSNIDVKLGFSKLIIETESIKKNLILLKDLGYSPDLEDEKFSLSDFLSLISKPSNIIQTDEILTFEVYECEENNEDSLEEILNQCKEDEKKDKNRKNNMPIENIESHTLIRPIHGNRRRDRTCRLHFMESNHKIDLSRKKIHESLDQQSLADSVRSKEPRVLRVKIFMLLWYGNEAIALLFEDISQKRTIRKLEEADENKDLVIAMISHELRTPLNGMLGIIDIVRKMIDDAEIASYLKSCKTTGLFLLNLVNSILDMSQIKNEKIKLAYTQFSLIDLLGSLKSLFEPLSSKKNLYFNVEIAKEVPSKIMTDKNRLSQILINLLGNAYKFTFEGGITVKVELDEKLPNRVRFCIQDTGLGIKLEDHKKLFKLFGRLEQKDNKTNNGGVGLGLAIANNLAILLNPSERQGIQLESKVGEGSTFFFFVEPEVKQTFQDQVLEEESSLSQELNSIEFHKDNFHSLETKLHFYTTATVINFEKMKSLSKYEAVGDNQPSRIQSQPGRTTQPIQGFPYKSCVIPFAGKKVLTGDSNNDTEAEKDLYTQTPIANLKKLEDLKLETESKGTTTKPWCLIVDDNPFNQLVASHMMEGKGYLIKTAFHGKEAIIQVEKHHENGQLFDIILMDCQMPIMDGFEATSILKERMKSGKINNCPIFALTANNRDEKLEKLCLEAGMTGTLGKPFDVNELEKVLKTLKRNKT